MSQATFSRRPLSAGAPDFGRVRKALLRQGEPDRVPLLEISVDASLKSRFLGRPVRTVEDDVEFWIGAGYDTVPAEAGVHLFVKDLAMTRHRAAYGVDASVLGERDWAPEGIGPIASQADLDSFPWPDVADLDFSRFAVLERALPAGARTIAVLGKVFTAVWWLLGFEGLCLALAEDSRLVERVFERVGQLQLATLERMLDFPSVGAVWNADDVAYSESLLVAPAVLRRHLFPWYSRMGDLCARRDVPMVFHSDGKLDDVLDDVVECGFDALNPIEPKAMDIVDVKRRYGDRLCLIGNVDLGYTLTRGTPEEVRAEVRERIRALAPGGGYCVASSNSIPEYVPYANFEAMREATLEYGRYPIGV
jgi:uroporphyrinogen decarboxylase